jgi:hypothetical protein
MGKVMEKAGSMLKNEGMVEKGQQKRAMAGNDEYTTQLGGNNNNNY